MSNGPSIGAAFFFGGTMLTIEKLAACMPQATATNIARFTEPLAAACAEFGIDTPGRLAAFLAQVAHESGELRTTVENLNYSAEALRKVFPRHFSDPATALDYARQPQRIANRVYANRMGNGDESSGDGWRHRGMGLIQVTGKQNQSACLAALGQDDPSYLMSDEGAARSAAWFWSVNKLNAYADKGDFDGVCDVVNRGRKTAAEGDSIGWADRKIHHGNALQALCVPGAIEEV